MIQDRTQLRKVLTSPSAVEQSPICAFNSLLEHPRFCWCLCETDIFFLLNPSLTPGLDGHCKTVYILQTEHLYLTQDAESFAGGMSGVNVVKGEKRGINDLSSCSHYTLEGLAAGRRAVAIPHHDADDVGWGSHSLWKKVETVLSLLDH